VYFIIFKSIVKYGIIFWGGAFDSNAVFKIQRKGLRPLKGVSNRVSCRSMFSDFKILTVTSLFLFEIFCFLKKNSGVQKYNTKGKQDLYGQLCNTACCQNVINMGIKVHNNLPFKLKRIGDFKV
jgi:hypothetical protein